MRIEIAGAGAGKTTSLAEKIINRYENQKDKNIYCISFTNSSVSTIQEKLEKYFHGALPSSIKISTIHSFLFSEIVHPYYFLLYQKQYKKIFNIDLPSDPRYRNMTLSNLDKNDILHVEKISERAKNVICGKQADKKAIKQIREIIVSSLSSYIDAIFVDEAQDIDQHFKDVLIKLSETEISIELIGDPKQDLKGSGNLRKLIDLYSEDVRYIENSHRCPQIHLSLSNKYIPIEESQKSLSSEEGTINIYFESEYNKLDSLISSYDICYIYQKHGSFDTKTVKSEGQLFEELKLILKGRLGVKELDGQQLVKVSKLSVAMLSRAMHQDQTPEDIVKFYFKYGTIATNIYHRLVNAIKSEIKNSQTDKIVVQSIDKVKGLGKNKCLFIVTPAMVPYLLNNVSQPSIKMSSYLYVALTRSKKQLDFLFTKEVEDKYSKEQLRNIFNE